MGAIKALDLAMQHLEAEMLSDIGRAVSSRGRERYKDPKWAAYMYVKAFIAEWYGEGKSTNPNVSWDTYVWWVKSGCEVPRLLPLTNKLADKRVCTFCYSRCT